MSFCNMAYVLLCLKCHMHIFIQVSAQLEHFDFFCFEPLYDPLMTYYYTAFV